MAEFWLYVSWLGTALFTIALVPQAVRTWRRKHAEDISIWFLVTVLAASVCMGLYMLSIPNVPASLGFVANIVVWGMVLWFRVYPQDGRVRP